MEIIRNLKYMRTKLKGNRANTDEKKKEDLGIKNH